MSNPRYGSGRSQFVGQGIEVDLSTLDPAAYTGAVAYSEGELYYSNGSDWVVPQDEVDIARPRNLAPTNALEQAQLRLSAFRSPTGETQTGVIFEFNTDGEPSFIEGANVETRTVTSEVASIYDVLYPEDGFQPGDTIWWRARYLGTNGTQSQFSIPTAQTFPDLITTPTPVTAQNAVTGTVTLSPYESAPIFGLEYLETQIEFYAEGDEVGVDTPITTVTQNGGAVTTVPIPPLTPGLNYQWRGRYGGRVNVSAPTVYSDWSNSRTFFLGAASIILTYNINLATARTISIPLGAAPVGEAYSIDINWGDGITENFTTSGLKEHTYAGGFSPTDGRVTVTISGRLARFGSDVTLSQPGLVRVDNIGFAMGLTSLRGLCRDTTPAFEYMTPNLPETVTSLSEMFRGSTANPASLADLDTRNVTDMGSMFNGAANFNQNIGAWDVSSVTTMIAMFAGTNSFNNGGSPDINNWDTSSVTSMGIMFQFANVFNQPIGNWDVSSVTSMGSMLYGAARFDQNIGAWDVSSVTNMSSMLRSMTDFNNGGSPDINNWDTSSVTAMSFLFNGSPNFNQPIGDWDTSSVTTMAIMFTGASTFNQNIGAWDVSSVTTMSGMFQNASAFNNGGSPNINNWDTSSVTNMSSMFISAGNFNQNIGAWDVSSVTNMSDMLRSMSAFNNGGSPDINNWDTSSVTTMSAMFQQTPSFNQPIGDWDVSSVTNMGNMFLSASTFNQNIGAWDVSSLGTAVGMFSGAVSFNNGGSPDISNWDTSSVTTMVNMFIAATSFNQPIGNWDVSSVTAMSSMLTNTTILNQNLGGWDLRKEGVIMNTLGGPGLTEENYSRTLIGWANYTSDTDGPYNVTLGVQATRLYNASNYYPGERFENAVDARAYLVGARAVSVSGASNALADGSYAYNGTTFSYDNANDWYFVVLGTSWALYDDTDTLQATGTGTAPGTSPQTATAWDGVLSAATVLRTGAGWTITGDALA